MKKIIDKLVELAKQYQEYGKVMQFYNTFTSLGDDGEVQVYFNGYDVCSVKFENVEVELYADKISLPFTIDEKGLERIYNRCAKLLVNLETKGKSTIEERIRKEKVQRIERLKSELESVQNELKNLTN